MMTIIWNTFISTYNLGWLLITSMTIEFFDILLAKSCLGIRHLPCVYMVFLCTKEKKLKHNYLFQKNCANQLVIAKASCHVWVYDWYGMLKSCFCMLQWIQITPYTWSFEKVLKDIWVAIILHNLLTRWKDEY